MILKVISENIPIIEHKQIVHENFWAALML